MRWCACVCWLCFSGCGSGGSATIQTVPPGATSIRVSTYNLYLGADLVPLFSTALDPSDVGPAVARTYAAVQASDPPARMDEVAALLARTPPDVVALQEVALWRTQSPADGRATAATTVAYDFLQLLLDGLARRGLTYSPVVIAERADVEATAALSPPIDVRLLDRDVLLLNQAAQLPVVATDQGTFTATFVVPTLAFDVVRIPRGWIALDTRVGGADLRVVDTHLESVAPPVRDAQLAELLSGPTTGSPLVLAGDFNLDPGTVAYAAIDQAGLRDAWTQAANGDPGPTCCQAADLRNATSMLDERIDFVFFRGLAGAADARRLGDDPADRTASGLWPSDHAGVAVRLAP